MRGTLKTNNKKISLTFFKMKFLAIFFITFSLSLLNVQSQGVATYYDIRNLPNRPEILLIDVRTLEEIERTGLIPTSIHIPSKFKFNSSINLISLCSCRFGISFKSHTCWFLHAISKNIAETCRSSDFDL